MKIAAVLLALMPGAALAQSAPNWPLDYIPGVQEWHDTWAGKADVSALALKADATQLTAYLGAGQTIAQMTSGGFDAAPVINAALAGVVAAGPVVLPCGAYTIATPLVMARDGAGLLGTPGCTIFNVTFASGDVIHLNGTHFQAVRDIAFNAAVSHGSGAALHLDRTFDIYLDRLRFYGLWNTDAMLFDASNSAFVDNFDCSNGPLFQSSSASSAGSCVHVINNALEIHLKHGLAARFNSGLRVSYGSGVYAESLDLLGGGNGVLVDPGAGQVVFGLFFANILGDTNYGDNWLFAGAGAINDVHCTNCWASSSGSGSGFSFNNAAVDGVQFSSSTAIGNYGDGFNFVAGQNFVVSGSAAEFNNLTNAVGGSGFHVHAGVSKVTLTGNRSGLGGTYKNVSGVANHQNQGIQVDAGAGDALAFVGNSLLGNVTAGMTILATGANIKAAGNVGFTEANGGAATFASGVTSIALATGVNAPDSRIVFSMTPMTGCGVTLSPGFVSSGQVGISASAAPSSACTFWWRASAWGN